MRLSCTLPSLGKLASAEGLVRVARLEQLLGARVGPVEVLSAAVPGWSTDQHFLYLRPRDDVDSSSWRTSL